uniref:Glycosyl transferase family 1 domain-containing protein n=1 Tax=Globisporangium ultimum (strain ATCC 200006 / CBS 805.95 / DAOM BR144) TaxID=431595 RepID=K3WJ28_GLOUD
MAPLSHLRQASQGASVLRIASWLLLAAWTVLEGAAGYTSSHPSDLILGDKLNRQLPSRRQVVDLHQHSEEERASVEQDEPAPILDNSSEPRIEITFPRNHSWWQTPPDGPALKFLHVHFATRSFNIPRDGYLLMTGHKLPENGFRYDGHESKFALVDLAPGSYFITLTLHRWNDHPVRPDNVAITVLHVEVVVPQQNLHPEWRYVMQGEDRKPMAFVNLPTVADRNTKTNHNVPADVVRRYNVTSQRHLTNIILEMFYEAFPHARSSFSSISPADYAKLHTIRAEFAVSFWQNVTKELQSCRDGVLVLGNARSAGDTAVVLAARMAGVKATIMELANLYPEPVEVDVLLGPSHYAVAHPSVAGVVRFKRSYVLSTGVDTDMFAPATSPSELNTWSKTGDQESRFTIGYVGRLATDKSVGIIIATAKLMKQSCQHCHFRIIGDGPLKKHLKILVQEWHLTDFVEFLDGIYNDEPALVRQLRTMSAYFSSGLLETLGIAALEAMSVGIPVVGFATGGASEYLSDGVNSIAVNEPTPEGFRNALMSLVQNSELKRKMGENARKTVLDRFSLNKCFAKYATLYQRLS